MGRPCQPGPWAYREAVQHGQSSSNRRPFEQDWATLFTLLQNGAITPIIPARYPLLAAAEANALFETGQVVGKHRSRSIVNSDSGPG